MIENVDFLSKTNLDVPKYDFQLPNTVNINQEEEFINTLIKNGNKQAKVIVYGKNNNDEKIYTKYNQLTSLGFYNVFIYQI